MDRERDPDPGQCSPRVLVAEDSPAMVALLRRALQVAGCRVDAVGNGFAAIEAALSGSYELIVLDLDMPGIGGIAATEAIRNAEFRNRIRRSSIVLLTADDSPDLPARCCAVGVDRCLSKSAASIHLLVDLARQAFSLQTKGIESPSADEGFDDLLLLYLEEANRQASRLAGLAQTGHLDEIERIGHQFHGGAPLYGLEELGELGAQLERAARARDLERTTEAGSKLVLLLAALRRS